MSGAWQNWQHYKETAANQAKYGSGGTASDIGSAILGGPAGMLSGALGQHNPLTAGGASFGAHLAHAELANASDGEALFNAMTDDEANAFEHMDGNQRAAFLAKLRTRVGAKTEQDTKEADYQKWRQSALQRLDDISKKMNMSVDQLIASGDSGARTAQGVGERQGAMQGLAAGAGGGGISNLNTQKAVADSLNNYQMQRQQVGLQATQGLLGGLQQEYMSDEDRRRYDDAIKQAEYNRGYQSQMNQSAGLMGLVGTGVGAYFGGAAGAQAGGQLGQAGGQYLYGQSNPYAPPPSSHSSGGLGGYKSPNYGGSQ